MSTFNATIKCDVTGVTLIEDGEFEIDAHVDGPYLVIDDVMLEGKSLFKGDALAQSIACRVASQAEDSDWLHNHFGTGDAYGEHRLTGSDYGLTRMAGRF